MFFFYFYIFFSTNHLDSSLCVPVIFSIAFLTNHVNAFSTIAIVFVLPLQCQREWNAQDHCHPVCTCDSNAFGSRVNSDRLQNFTAHSFHFVESIAIVAYRLFLPHSIFYIPRPAPPKYYFQHEARHKKSTESLNTLKCDSSRLTIYECNGSKLQTFSRFVSVERIVIHTQYIYE